MTQTLLEMCTEVMEDISGIVVPSYLFTNTDDTAKQLISIAKRVGRSLVRMNWQQLEEVATVTTVSGTDNYALEADYHSMTPETSWNSTDAVQMIGAETSSAWQAIVNLPVAVAQSHYFRIRKNRIYVKPTPTSVWSFNYEYRSKYYCTNSGGTGIREWAADNDLPKLPEDVFIAAIKYLFLKGNGLEYGEAEAEIEGLLRHYGAINKPHGVIDMGALARARTSMSLGNLLNIPDRVDY